MKFNINKYVRVRLNDTGRAELKRQHDELRKAFPTLGEFIPPEEDSDGWSTWQLWALMESLGHLNRIGSSGPFDTEIEICE